MRRDIEMVKNPQPSQNLDGFLGQDGKNKFKLIEHANALAKNDHTKMMKFERLRFIILKDSIYGVNLC